MNATEEDLKTLAHIELLSELRLNKKQLEAMAIGLLQFIYKSNDRMIVDHISKLSKIAV